MNKVLVFFLMVGVLFAKEGIVDTNVLLIKKEPSNSSVKFGFYKKNEIIDVLSEHNGTDSSEKWFKTARGYVKAQYIILEEVLPQFINKEKVDYSKNAIQLVVYNKSVVEGLRNLRKLLIKEKNLFKQASKNVNVIYLTNFDSYVEANDKRKELKKHFPSAFITKLREKNTQSFVKKKNVIRKSSKRIVNNIDKYEDENDFNIIGSNKSEELSYKELQDLKNIENEKPILDNILDEPSVNNYSSGSKTNINDIMIQRAKSKTTTLVTSKPIIKTYEKKTKINNKTNINDRMLKATKKKVKYVQPSIKKQNINDRMLKAAKKQKQTILNKKDKIKPVDSINTIKVVKKKTENKNKSFDSVVENILINLN